MASPFDTEEANGVKGKVYRRTVQQSACFGASGSSRLVWRVCYTRRTWGRKIGKEVAATASQGTALVAKKKAPVKVALRIESKLNDG